MELSIVNAGRGSGKTYNLVQWAKADPKRYVVGTAPTRDVMAEAGLRSQFVHYTHAKEFFAGHRNFEVAFDDFETDLYSLLAINYRLSGAKSVILAINIPVSEVAPKIGFTSLPKAYADALKAKYPGLEGPLAQTNIFLNNLVEVAKTISPDDWRSDNGFAETKQEPVPQEAEPDTKKVRVDQLRLGDRIVGKGIVDSLQLLPGTSSTQDKVELTVKADYFTGTMKVFRYAEVEIENK